MKTILLTSSLLILLLAALDPLLRGRIKPQVQYALWLLVALRLLIPVNLGNSALSALAVLDRIEQPPVLERISQTPISIRSYDSTYREIAGEYRRRGADPDTLPAGTWPTWRPRPGHWRKKFPFQSLLSGGQSLFGWAARQPWARGFWR